MWRFIHLGRCRESVDGLLLPQLVMMTQTPGFHQVKLIQLNPFKPAYYIFTYSDMNCEFTETETWTYLVSHSQRISSCRPIFCCRDQVNLFIDYFHAHHYNHVRVRPCLPKQQSAVYHSIVNYSFKIYRYSSSNCAIPTKKCVVYCKYFRFLHLCLPLLNVSNLSFLAPLLLQ